VVNFLTKRLWIKGPKKVMWWLGHMEIVRKALAVKRNDCNTAMKKIVIGTLAGWCYYNDA
jgi:hypothetical protein